MTGSGVGHREAGPRRPAGVRLEGGGEGLLHHVGVVDTLPQVAAGRHVAILAAHPVGRVGGRGPLRPGLLQELAFEGLLAGLEVVAGRAETGVLVLVPGHEAVVGGVGDRARLGGPVAGPRADVAGGAGHRFDPQGCHVGGVRAFRALGVLFGERCVARLALVHQRGLGGVPVHQLPEDARAHRVGVPALLPVGVLADVAAPTRRGREVGFNGSPSGRRGALRRHRGGEVRAQPIGAGVHGAGDEGCRVRGLERRRAGRGRDGSQTGPRGPPGEGDHPDRGAPEEAGGERGGHEAKKTRPPCRSTEASISA